jgi:hypothetical protein
MALRILRRRASLVADGAKRTWPSLRPMVLGYTALHRATVAFRPWQNHNRRSEGEIQSDCNSGERCARAIDRYRQTSTALRISYHPSAPIPHYSPSLPFDGPRWLARHVIDNPVDASDFIDDPRRRPAQDSKVEGIKIRGHAVD